MCNVAHLIVDQCVTFTVLWVFPLAGDQANGLKGTVDPEGWGQGMVRGMRTAVSMGATAATPITAFGPAASWTHKVDSEEKRKHDFSNLLLEFRYAVERADQMMMEYCDGELERMYREKGQRTGAR